MQVEPVALADEDEDEEFRAEVIDWLEKNAPHSLRGKRYAFGEGVFGGRYATFESEDARRWMEAMASRGWTAPTWPTDYGGGGLSRRQHKILQTELLNLRMPPPLFGLGLIMIGPTLLEFGTEDQKRQHLPKIVNGEIRWCQGYSEPGAGSDLASLRTMAIRDGDEFVVNGQKIWTSYADKSDWVFALVRTDPASRRQQGISFILIDMESPGITTRPIELISGTSSFCETFFDNVRVPVVNVLGEIDQGWVVAKALLGYEREVWGGAGGSGSKKPRGSVLAQFAKDHRGESGGAISDPLLRHRVAQLEMDALALAQTVQRGRDAAKVGRRPGEEMSLLKLFGAELTKRRFEAMIDIAGPDTMYWQSPELPPELKNLASQWLRSRANSIEGGTSETQLNIIAKRILKLPVRN